MAYDTKLNTEEETQYQKYAQSLGDKGNTIDYDLRGYWKNIARVHPKESPTATNDKHFPDTYKKPNHPGFSTESIYATGGDKAWAGSWGGASGDDYQPSKLRRIMQGPKDEKRMNAMTKLKMELSNK